MVSQPRTHSRDSDASYAPAEDRLLEYTTAQPQKGRNKETPPCSNKTQTTQTINTGVMGGGKGEQAFKTLGLKEELCVTRIPGASSATSIPGQELEKSTIGNVNGCG